MKFKKGDRVIALNKAGFNQCGKPGYFKEYIGFTDVDWARIDFDDGKWAQFPIHMIKFYNDQLIKSYLGLRDEI